MNDNDRVAGEADPATEAFSRLEREMALMRRAVEHLAAEKADITIPDYTATLGEMSQRLARTQQTLQAIVDKPAMELTPESLAQRIDHAGRSARRTDHEELRGACGRYDSAARELREVIATAKTALEQRRQLWWTAGGGLVVGCLLWAILPGVILRALPDSWHGPEMVATHIVGEPSMWEAGTRLMHGGDPGAWQALVDAVDMKRNNIETIRACEEAAVNANGPVRCTIEVEPRKHLIGPTGSRR